MAVSSLVDSWVSDLIKIGIPSLFAVASLVANCWQTRKGHEKDLTIEKLRHSAEAWKAMTEKRSALVMEIATKITAAENALAMHSGIFRKHGIADESQVSDEILDEARTVFAGVNATVDSCIGATVLVRLLGDAKTTAQFELFLQSLFSFQKYANPNQSMDRFELMEWSDKVKHQKNAVLGSLSAIYLDAPA